MCLYVRAYYRGGKMEFKISSVGVKFVFSSRFAAAAAFDPAGPPMAPRPSFVVDTNMGLSYRTSELCGGNNDVRVFDMMSCMCV